MDDSNAPKPHLTSANIVSILVAGMGSFLFGYCNNAIAGTFAQTSFTSKFLAGDNAEAITGGILGGFLSGGLIGAIIQAPISQRFGRRAGTATAAVLTVVSAALQAGAVNIAMFLAARTLCGIGAGIVITNVPVYMSEIAPPHLRGLLVGNHATSIVYAYIVSSVLALGFSFVEHPYAWRLQYVMLAFFGVVLLVSLLFLPESPRWLAERERYDEAWAVLQRLHRSKNSRDGDDTLARAEMVQIRAQIAEEHAQPTGYWHILTTPNLRHRAYCSVLVWVVGQSTGILVIANLTPVLFGQLGYSTLLQLGLSIVWTVVALIGCIVNSLLMDRLGRVKLMVAGGYLCSAVLIIEAVLQKYYLGAAVPNTAGINAAVAMYFLFIFFYGSTLDCACYVYISEIWPTHHRSRGSTIGLVSFFLTSLAYTSPATKAFATIGWRYYFVMASVCIAASTLMLFVLPETARLTLEEIAEKFGETVVVRLGEAAEEKREVVVEYKEKP